MAEIIDGKKIAADIRSSLKQRIEELKKTRGRTPGIVVILVGNDPASQIYVRNKKRACEEVGISSRVHQLPETVTQGALVSIIEGYNNDPEVDGILVQLPLPEQISEEQIQNAIDPRKDVDGFHLLNEGALFSGRSGVLSCTPQGIIELIRSTGTEIEGKHAVVVGRSTIVGKPVAMMLLENNATVTICHSRTPDLADKCADADILVVATGQPELIGADHVKEGAVVIDVGTNRVGDSLVGDVDFEAVSEKAGYITPVPGGVGPMTIAMLLANTVDSYERGH
ncbi:MAG: bifunctional methylenetetrahydrofolate dehydrogenase/methenyltetrahydrofolate cyclohydrolase FolD [Clostridia bacterium]|nr:bifunctional methylenetetrahydrofolate dehydrogenase/methenyltetrahydrofolate cyclohydrolase FolD [Clostridia bacterium]